jgi:hypothetical protein
VTSNRRSRQRQAQPESRAALPNILTWSLRTSVVRHRIRSTSHPEHPCLLASNLKSSWGRKELETSVPSLPSLRSPSRVRIRSLPCLPHCVIGISAPILKTPHLSLNAGPHEITESAINSRGGFDRCCFKASGIFRSERSLPQFSE